MLRFEGKKNIVNVSSLMSFKCGEIKLIICYICFICDLHNFSVSDSCNSSIYEYGHFICYDLEKKFSLYIVLVSHI